MSKQKTIREWFEELPEPHRSQAIENGENSQNYAMDDITSSLSGALSGGFVWSESKEGDDYWDKFRDDLIDKGQ
jgi:hypothetical protein